MIGLIVSYATVSRSSAPSSPKPNGSSLFLRDGDGDDDDIVERLVTVQRICSLGLLVFVAGLVGFRWSPVASSVDSDEVWGSENDATVSQSPMPSSINFGNLDLF
ncbi:hypothetical protein TIFTF001_017922 [Ficus carica]|uniref:Uncharacterized protein n=1 Tax=Ficus carica TaxID=3494 RepID=A0AA88D8T1_FICCA|nr:hypothetical protein TIFTF001_017922 [Ficus carica]